MGKETYCLHSSQVFRAINNLDTTLEVTPEMVTSASALLFMNTIEFLTVHLYHELSHESLRCIKDLRDSKKTLI